MLVGVGITLLLAFQYHRNAVEKTTESFTAAAQDRIELIHSKIEHNKIILHSISAFFQASDSVKREEFSVYTKQILENYPYIYTLEWIPHISYAERSSFEQNSDYPDLKIIQKSENDTYIPAGERKDYFPIYYAEPLENNNANILGYDIASDPDRYEALTQAQNKRALSTTGRVYLLQNNEVDIPAVIFFEPVFLKSSFEDSLGVAKLYVNMEGFIGSVVPLADMLDAAIAPLSLNGVNIIIHDLSAKDVEDQFLYARSTRLKNISEAEIREDYNNLDILREKALINVGGRTWQITILPARGYFAVNLTKDTFVIISIGLLITFLLSAYMYGRIRENETIIQEVEERTQQLSKAKREIEMVLLSTHEGITGLDQNGNISFCNVTASKLLGYRKQELIGQHHHTLFHSKHPDGTPYDITDCPIQKVLDYGQSCNIRNEVFWNRKNEAVKVEYSGSPILEEGEVVGAVLVFRDISKRLELEKELEQMARYDQLTGLANRGLFVELLKNALSRSGRTDRKIGVVYLDLNGFKEINDTLGHAAGDVMLKGFAERLKSVVRDSDVPARMGGDEFTILVDNLSTIEELEPMINRLKKSMREPYIIQNKEFIVGASIGVALYPDHADDYETLISHADTAMYQAKNDKSQPYVIYVS